MTDQEGSPAFLALVLGGGVLFGFGLGYSEMARPEVVLSFLQLVDLGLVFVMGGAATVTALTIFAAMRFRERAPLTGRHYERRLKSMDSDVLTGGSIFGVGWGLSGICPGAAYASLGIGNYPILIGIAGMFLGAYLQAYWRSVRTESRAAAVGAD